MIVHHILKLKNVKQKMFFICFKDLGKFVIVIKNKLTWIDCLLFQPFKLKYWYFKKPNFEPNYVFTQPPLDALGRYFPESE